MSSDYYGGIAGEIADEGSAPSEAGPEWQPDTCGVGFCQDIPSHRCPGYCGNCGIHLDMHGTRCGEYATEGPDA